MRRCSVNPLGRYCDPLVNVHGEASCRWCWSVLLSSEDLDCARVALADEQKMHGGRQERAVCPGCGKETRVEDGRIVAHAFPRMVNPFTRRVKDTLCSTGSPVAGLDESLAKES